MVLLKNNLIGAPPGQINPRKIKQRPFAFGQTAKINFF